jgi:hypothetical protein
MQLPETETTMRQPFAELHPGDCVEVLHHVLVGAQRWTTTTRGTVVSTERRRHGLHFQRASDDKVWSDLIVVRRDDGELTTVTIDEFTEIHVL